MDFTGELPWRRNVRIATANTSIAHSAEAYSNCRYWLWCRCGHSGARTATAVSTLLPLPQIQSHPTPQHRASFHRRSALRSRDDRNSGLRCAELSGI